jgi:transcription initiation factor TFIID subunit 7
MSVSYFIFSDGYIRPTDTFFFFSGTEEELVDFCEWMVDESHPNGIVITDELELIKRHPEYLDLSEEPSEKKRKGNTRANEAMSAINTPIVTDVGSDADAESHVGRDSAQRSPVLAPTPSPTISNDMEDKNVQDLEDDLLDDLEETKEEETQKKPSYHTDPGYLKYVENRGRLQKSLRDEERNVSDLTTKVNTNSNIVVKVRRVLLHKRRIRIEKNS